MTHGIHMRLTDQLCMLVFKDELNQKVKLIVENPEIGLIL